MGNSWTSDKRDYSTNWSPYGNDFERSGRRSSKRWNARKPRGYYKTVSDLGVERELPLYLRYQEPNSVDDELFSMHARIPGVIHLHQRARQDFNHLLRCSEAYAKQPRPKSLDPTLLMESFSCEEMDPCSPQSPRNTSFVSTSGHVNSKVNQEHDKSLQSPDEKMKIDPSATGVDIVKVDTSGAKFERQANLRRSQRLSSCTSSVRQRANASQRRQLRHKHKTLVGLPGNIESDITDVNVSRPYSVHSGVNGYSYIERSSIESRTTNGHAIISPRRNLKSVEIQTDDVKVIPLTPSQRRMRQKGIESHHTSRSSSHGSHEFLGPTAAPCPKAHVTKQTSTPVNGVYEKDAKRFSMIKAENNDTSTDEGRHTGESGPPTPVRVGTPTLAGPELKSSSPAPNKFNANGGQSSNNNNSAKKVPSDIAMRMNAGRIYQGEDRASSGFWSGTESIQHSSSSDITTQYAPALSTLKSTQRQDRNSPILSNASGHIFPIGHSRPLVCSSTMSSSSVSINSKLSCLDIGASDSSSYQDDDELFQSANSSIISVTLNRSNNASSLSLNSTVSDGGNAMTAAAMLKISRKSGSNAARGTYSFMNYDADPLDTGTDEVSRAVKNRRPARGMKHRGSKKRLAAQDADSVPIVTQETALDNLSTLSGGRVTDNGEGRFSEWHENVDYTSPPSIGDCGITANGTVICNSALPVGQAGSDASLHYKDYGIAKTTLVVPTPVSSALVTSTSVTHDILLSGNFSFASEGTPDLKNDRSSYYNSYNRAVNNNHSTPISLLTLTGKSESESVRTPSHISSQGLDFQLELNKRLSIRRDGDNLKTEKKGAPPPPKRASSLSRNSSPLPSSKSFSKKELLGQALVPSKSVALPAGKQTRLQQDTTASTEGCSEKISAQHSCSLPPPPIEMISPESEPALTSPVLKYRPPAPPKPIRISSKNRNAPGLTVKSPESPKATAKASSLKQSTQTTPSGGCLLEKMKVVENQRPKLKVKGAVETEISADVNHICETDGRISVTSKLDLPKPSETAEKDRLQPTTSKTSAPIIHKRTIVSASSAELTSTSSVASITSPSSSPVANIPSPTDEITLLPPTSATILPPEPELATVLLPSTEISPTTTGSTSSEDSVPKDPPPTSNPDLASPKVSNILPPAAEVISVPLKTPYISPSSLKIPHSDGTQVSVSPSTDIFSPTSSSASSVANIQPLIGVVAASPSSVVNNVRPIAEMAPVSPPFADISPQAAEMAEALPPKIPSPLSENQFGPVLASLGQEFAAERSKKQSPSYRKTSVARAAFFAGVSPPPAIAPKPTIKIRSVSSMRGSETPARIEKAIKTPKQCLRESQEMKDGAVKLPVASKPGKALSVGENQTKDCRDHSTEENRMLEKDAQKGVEKSAENSENLTKIEQNFAILSESEKTFENARENEKNSEKDTKEIVKYSPENSEESVQDVQMPPGSFRNGENERNLSKNVSEMNDAPNNLTERSYDVHDGETTGKLTESSSSYLDTGMSGEKSLNATDAMNRSRPNAPEYFTFAEENDCNNWLQKMEEFSAPNRPPKCSPSELKSTRNSAASRLGLSLVKPSSKYSTHESLMAAIHKSKRETFLGKQLNLSPPVSPETNSEVFTYKANVSKSPGSTLERKRNGRLSSNGTIRNALSRRSSGGTSRNDFKALLLQNACKGSFGSQMTAAEKLRLNRPTNASSTSSKQRPLSMNDIDKKMEQEDEQQDKSEENSDRVMLSLGDIHSAINCGFATTSRIGRSGRRGQKSSRMEVGRKYATLSVHGKKHPPPSLSSKYNVRSRTPTRPMMAISEDNEIEKSPEQIRSRPRLEER